MSNTLSLADIQKAATERYGDYVIPVEGAEALRFRNPMRLPRESRQRLGNLFNTEQMLKRAEEDHTLDIYDLYREAFELAAVSPAHYETLSAAVGDDPATWTLLFEEFGQATAVGEASPSVD